MLHSSTSPTPDLLSTHPFSRCKDSRQEGTSAEFHSSTGYEPKRIELDRTLLNLSYQAIDNQDDIEEIGVKPLSYSQSLIHSAYESAESIATPPDSDLEDEQLRKMLAYHCIPKYQGNLMQEVGRSEKQMHNEHKLVIQDEKV